METYTSDSLVDARMPLAYGDVRKAFAYYLEHYNNGRPFILAGFSQGAMAVVDLLKSMDDSTYSRLVAAYVIGYKVTDTNAHISPAQDSADLGVTICYNSVRDNSCAIPFLSDGNPHRHARHHESAAAYRRLHAQRLHAAPRRLRGQLSLS